MHENHARKAEVRRRMARTGEKYTTALRAIEAEQASVAGPGAEKQGAFARGLAGNGSGREVAEITARLREVTDEELRALCSAGEADPAAENHAGEFAMFRRGLALLTDEELERFRLRAGAVWPFLAERVDYLDPAEVNEIAEMGMSLGLEWAEAVRKLGTPIDGAREQLRQLRQGGGNLDALERALDEADQILNVLSDAEMGTTAGMLQKELGFPPGWPLDNDEQPLWWDGPDTEATAQRKRRFLAAEESRMESGREAAIPDSGPGEPVSDDALAQMERRLAAKFASEQESRS